MTSGGTSSVGRHERARSRIAAARRLGTSGLAQRFANRAFHATGARALWFPLAADDVLEDVPASLPEPTTRPVRGGPLRIGWVMFPPGPGSGGHTTIFRMIEALEARGHRCVVFAYLRDGVDVGTVAAIIRSSWPKVDVDVRSAKDGISGVDAAIATSWETAHVLARRGGAPTRRLYFVQDYEPYFYPRGAEHELAALTYRLPFRRIALGEMLEAMIREETGQASDLVPFGCDSSAYRLPQPAVPRSGIVLYAKPDAARRGFELARLALERFHELHPEQEIHVYGERPVGMTVPFTFHGRLRVPELNELYGRTVAGLAMSFTNITLVAEEMLAAGNIPVVNDMALARLVLPNPHVRWTEPTVQALARALSDAVEAPDLLERAASAAASVVGRSWRPTQEAVADIVEAEVYGPDPSL